MDSISRPDVNRAVRLIQEKLELDALKNALLVGISGIDGSGKGYVGRLLEETLQGLGHRVALVHADDWHQLPDARFGPDYSVIGFYDNGLRLDEMFNDFLLPFKEHGRINKKINSATCTATRYQQQTLAFDSVDLILVEGIFLFKAKYQSYFDLKIWVDCLQTTALRRALHRRQEHLSDAETIDIYRSIFFPAQRVHRVNDNPQAVADVLVFNDPDLLSLAGVA